MPLSWNDIRHRAIKYSREWKSAVSEKSERQTFWNEFFDVFGVRRRTVASFEEPVRNLGGNWGFIDLFWPGKLLVEHKSAGQDLDKAHAQGMAYIRGLVDQGRQSEVPRWLIVSDFQRIAIHDLEPEPEPAPAGSAAAFFLPRAIKPLFSNNRVEVTRHAAANRGAPPNLVSVKPTRLTFRRYTVTARHGNGS